MAKKVGSRGNVTFDYHNLTPEQKQKVTLLYEQFPEMGKDHIAIVLQHYQYDYDKTVDGITSDGGADALKSWQAQCNLVKANNKNKKRNKKKNKKEDSSVSSSTAALCYDPDDSSSLHSSNVDFDGEKESNTKVDDCDDASERAEQDTSCVGSSLVSQPTCDELSLSDTLVENEGSGSPLRTATDPEDVAEDLATETRADSPKCEILESLEKTSAASGSPREKGDDQSRNAIQNQFNRQRHGSSHHSKSSSFSEDTSSSTTQKRAANAGLNKCKKDLIRQSASLQRIENQLEKHLDDAYKSMKNAFSEIRQKLDERQQKLEQELDKVKGEARSLLKSRQDLSSDLKRRCDRAQSMSDPEWNDLRADIKQFVTERKYDEELRKTLWFQWAVDHLTEEIAKFGEVLPVKNAYSQRQASQVNSPEPNETSSVPLDDESNVAVPNAVFENALVPDDNNEVEENKPEKDVQVKNVVQGETRNRVYTNKRYSQYGGRYQHNQGQGGYYRGRGGHMRGYQRGRNYDQYRQYGGERSNDYRQQYNQHHNRTDFAHANEDKPADSNMNAPAENSNPRYGMAPRDNQGHFRAHEQRPYNNRGFRSRPFHNYNNSWPRNQNRGQRLNTESASTGIESAVDKNANNNEAAAAVYSRSQENKGMYNGYQ